MRLGALRAKSDLGALLPFGKALYREQAVAIFRLIAALSFVGVFPLIRPLTGDHEFWAGAILFGYALASLIILARMFLAGAASTAFLILIHILDLVWPALICLFTGCARSPFLLLFIFALLAVPYRRRSLETIVIALLSILIVLSETTVASMPAFAKFHLMQRALQAGPFAVKGALLLVVGGFQAYTAYWAEREQQAYATRLVLRRLHATAGVETNLREILPAMMQVFEARRVVLVLRNSTTWRVFQWGISDAGKAPPVRRELPFSEEDQYFWPMPAGCTSVAYSRNGRHRDFLALNRQGSRAQVGLKKLWRTFVWEEPFHTILATSLQFGSEWTGRIFLVDPPCAAGRESCLRLLQQMAEEVGPAAYNFYRWQHTSARVRAVERQRLARDLHDGVVQSLIATDMQLEVLRRRNAHPGTLRSGDPMRDVQDVLRTEVRKLREQIEQLRSSAQRRPVLPSLAEMLDNFQRETSIVTRFAFDVQEESIPDRVSGEIVQIVQEALSNVRKHSGARKVEVRITSHQDAWEVMVQDDGCGFDFSGRLSLAQLEAEQKGPRVIRERVHSVNGQLTLESYPNWGSRLKVRLASHS